MAFRSSGAATGFWMRGASASSAPRGWNTLSPMTTGPGRTARDLFMAAEEALVEAAFCTGEFAGAERVFGEAQAVATRDGESRE